MHESTTSVSADGPSPFGRRRLLAGAGVALGAVAVAGPARALASPSFGVRRRYGPSLTSGLQAGDVSDRGAVLWARADAPGRMWAALATRESGRGERIVRGPVVTEATDLTGQIRLRGLRSGQRIAYRIWFEDAEGHAGLGESGSFATPSRRDDAVTFVWTGDCAGQGWGINPDWGGMRGFEAMRVTAPDFFVFSGDTVYADGPLVPQVTLADGSVWRNVVTPEKSKVAETLQEFRGQWRYNLLDDNVRRFNAEVPVIAQWDDHEVTNNWYPGEVLTSTGPDARYTEKRVDVLAARATQAFQEYFPITERRPGPVHRAISYGPLLDVFVLDMRTYRGPNTDGREPGGSPILGAEQVAWLQRELRRSSAVWKVIAADMPIGLIVPDGANIEAIAQGDPGAPLGREAEIAAVLAGIKRDGVRNVVWFTADVHYTAAHLYDPAAASFTDFDPFWEFVAGPINAGTFGPNVLEPTFGPQAVFVESAAFPNQPPTDGRQYFGHVTVTAEAMVVELIDIAGVTLHTTEIDAVR